MKKILAVLLTLTLLIQLFGCRKVSFDESKGELVIGLECEYAPFNWTETENTLSNVEIYGQRNLYAEGYDIEMAKLIAQELGLRLVVKKIAWDGLIPALESGEIDAIIAGMSPTAKRKESINFSDPYYETQHVVVVKKDGPYANATRFTDFSNANIVGQRGTSYETLAEQLAQKAGTTANSPLATVPLIISGILVGDNDVTVIEKPVALGVCASNPELKYIELIDQFEVDEEEKVVSIGLRKVDTNLLNLINDALAKISAETRESLMVSAIESGE